jgi:hypothetical protein
MLDRVERAAGRQGCGRRCIRVLTGISQARQNEPASCDSRPAPSVGGSNCPMCVHACEGRSLLGSAADHVGTELKARASAGLSLHLPSARRWAAQVGPVRAGTPGNGGSCRQAVCTRHGRLSGLVEDGRGPTRRRRATCKIAGIAYTGSNPVPATPALTSNNAVAGRPIKWGSRVGFPSGFPPPDAQPTPPVNLALLSPTCPRSPRPAGARSGGAGGCRRAGPGRRRRHGAAGRR